MRRNQRREILRRVRAKMGESAFEEGDDLISTRATSDEAFEWLERLPNGRVIPGTGEDEEITDADIEEFIQWQDGFLDRLRARRSHDWKPGDP